MLRFRPRPRLWPAAAALLAFLLSASAAAAASPTGSRPATKALRYHGYRLVVPAAWPVFNLATNPTVCVRFNRHAVYLGQPSSRQRCPAHAVGRTEAILVQPLAAHSAGAANATGPMLPQDRRAQPRNGSSTQLAVPSKGVLVTATWARDPSVVARALQVRSLNADSAPTTHRNKPARAAAARRHAVHRAGDPLYTGLGFDACSTPSTSAMSAWAASPYRAVGIYIGGANEACAQANLSATWVEQESAAGWVLLPIYVGLQAPNNGCGCASIVPAQASAEGTAAADDAVNQAEAVGLAPGNPIYDDMESYNRNATNTPAVLAFLSAWTTELHARGYASGVYSSATTGVTDLVQQYGTGYVEPDQIWNAEWNNQQTTTSAYLPSTDWVNHQRLHQYQGGHNATYGGVTINIDSDYVDAGAASGAAAFPNGTFVQVTGTTSYWEIAGGAPLLVSDWSAVGGAQPYTVITQEQYDALNPVPADGTVFQTNTGGVYIVAGGAPMWVTSTSVFNPPPVPFLVDEWNVDNAGNPASHLNPVPSNGTFLTTTLGQNYRVVGGAPIAITSWTPFGGVKPSVVIDPWDVANIFTPQSHLVYRPSVGSVVQGLPSGAYWRFGPKNRYLIPASPGAVRVDDRGLKPFSAIPCRVPNLAHKTLTQVKAALIKADCHLGKVHRHLVKRHRHILHVTKQVPRARTKHVAYYTVGITLG
ncbi:MAG TPA: glycoside hydrolase domain-containing protein [Solirubrobacteraceae bacterium]|nr:glycoside hydrolase domain-containing protein [Solirubrobacteraceae bacterium]